MTLVITALFSFGRYDAASSLDAGRVEYPPDSARLFCALRDVATDDELPVLDLLEGLPPPEIWAPQHPLGEDRRHGFVVTNTVERAGTSQFHPGRTNGFTHRVGTILADPTVRFVWPRAQIERELPVLQDMLDRIHYLGRSTSVTLLTASTESPQRPQQFFRPMPRTGNVGIRAPYPGYRAALDAAHTAGTPAWGVSQEVPYAFTTAAAPDEPDDGKTASRSSFADFNVWRLNVHPGLVSAGDISGLTNLFRRAVHRRVWNSLGLGPDFTMTDVTAKAAGIAPAISGHSRGGGHLAFVALPNVGHHRADGRPLGVALLVPRLQDPADLAALRRQLYRAIDGLTELSPWRNSRTIELDEVNQTSADHRLATTLQVNRWCRPSRHWATATPYVLDRHTKGRNLFEAFAYSCGLAGLPAPRRVAMRREPYVAGGIVLRPSDIVWGNRPRRPHYHVAAEFDQPVAGPVLVGALRFMGLGLMTQLEPKEFERLIAPEPEHSEAR